MVDSVKQAEDDAIRLALGSMLGNSEQPAFAPTPVSVTVPTQTLKTPLKAGEKMPQPEKGGTPANAAVNTTTPISPRPLVLYAYSESKTARPNLEFFIRHALNDAADFIFILNGPTNVGILLPNLPNIKVIQRENDCYDLGAYAEVLQTDDLYKGYEKFILLNASIRGPFMPYWSNMCWMDMYLGKITEEVKVCPLFSFPVIFPL